MAVVNGVKFSLPLVKAKSRNLSASFGRSPAWKASNKQNIRVVKSLPEGKMTSGVDSSLDMVFSSLTSFSQLDGRHWAAVRELSPFMSEYAHIKFQVLVEIRWLLMLSEISEMPEVPRFSEGAKSYLESIFDQFSVDDALEVKKNEKVTDEDAVVYFLKRRCESHPEISKVLAFFHFACSSEEIKTLAHAVMLKEAIRKVILPAMDELITAIHDMAIANASIPLLSVLVDQIASPTTSGRELAIIISRLIEEREKLSQADIFGKFTGNSGDYTEHLSAYPDVNWRQIAKEFVRSFGLSFSPVVNQYQMVPSFFIFAVIPILNFNHTLALLVKSIRDYISFGHGQEMLEPDDEIEPLIMLLHKIDPVDFEDSERNCVIANIGWNEFCKNLNDWGLEIASIILWNVVARFGHSLLAYKGAMRGIAELQSQLGTTGEKRDKKA